jgi:hypothetical protein
MIRHFVRCGTDQAEDIKEGFCIERATESAYIHNQMSKQVTKSHVSDAVHMYVVN